MKTLALLLLATAAGAEPVRLALLPPPAVARAEEAVRAVAERYGLPLTTLTPDQVIDPTILSVRRFDVAVLAAREEVLTTVRTPGDALAALQRFVAEGGTLLVGGFVWPLYRPVGPTGPVPAPPATVILDPALRRLYEATGPAATGALNLAFGLPVGHGEASPFETPEEPVRLVVPPGQTRVPAWSGELPWPADGDQRYRGLGWRDLPEHLELTPLVRLVGESGREYGAGAAVVRFREGPLRAGQVVYAWNTLFEQPLVLAALLATSERRGPPEQAPVAAAEALAGTVEELDRRLAAAAPETPALTYLRRELAEIRQRLAEAPTLVGLGCDKAAATTVEWARHRCARLAARLESVTP